MQILLLLLLLSHFSRVQLCATPSLGFSRQEHWSGLPFPSPMHKNEKWKWSCSVVSDSSRPHGLQLSGSSVHGIFQARVLEWGAIHPTDLLLELFYYCCFIIFVLLCECHLKVYIHFLSWSRVDLQLFRCNSKWVSYLYNIHITCIYLHIHTHMFSCTSSPS